eukprot:TRINITY_DN20213_c0_g3_i2.p1 TRINITY_DN20213_c0_g3~~TRINITY_DN20213_c0_g3_i2.p1  ORF type:complete len:1148 (+),score=313.11 TRINITY_DN20213_c0_g3_i2:95-3445(+)
MDFDAAAARVRMMEMQAESDRGSRAAQEPVAASSSAHQPTERSEDAMSFFGIGRLAHASGASAADVSGSSTGIAAHVSANAAGAALAAIGLGGAAAPVPASPAQNLTAEGDVPLAAEGSVDGAARGTETGARQRSSSPYGSWQFKLSAQAASRVRSGECSGISTPVRGTASSVRALSGTRGYQSASQQVSVRASQDSALLAAVRKQLEALDEKFTNQMTRMQGQTDRMREAANKRLEEKLSAFEGAQPRLERRLAELSGNYKGLSDELQAQIRRVDQMDERHWDWRHSLEDDHRQKYADLEQQAQKAASAARVSGASLEEDRKRHHQRLLKLENQYLDHQQSHDDTREGLLHLHARLEALETNPSLNGDHTAALLLAPASSAAPAAADTSGELVRLLERRVIEGQDRVEKVLADYHDVHAKLEAQEERLRGLRTLMEAREEHWRTLGERLERHDWEGRLEQLRQSQQQEARHRSEHQEHLQLITRRLEHQEQSHEQLQKTHQELFARGSASRDVSTAVSSDLEEIDARFRELALRLDLLESDVAASQRSGIEDRVADLVAQLQDLAPAIHENQTAVRELRDAQIRGGCEVGGAADADSEERVKRLVETLQGLTPHVTENSAKTQELAARLDALELDVRGSSAEHGGGGGGGGVNEAQQSEGAGTVAVADARLEALVGQLREVVPKVLQQDQDLACLVARVSGVETEIAAVGERLQPVLAGMQALMSTAQGGAVLSDVNSTPNAAARSGAGDDSVVACEQRAQDTDHPHFAQRFSELEGSFAEHSAAAERRHGDLADIFAKHREFQHSRHEELVKHVEEAHRAMEERFATVVASSTAVATSGGAAGDAASKAAEEAAAAAAALERRLEAHELRVRSQHDDLSDALAELRRHQQLTAAGLDEVKSSALADGRQHSDMHVHLGALKEELATLRSADTSSRAKLEEALAPQLAGFKDELHSVVGTLKREITLITEREANGAADVASVRRDVAVLQEALKEFGQRALTKPDVADLALAVRKDEMEEMAIHDRLVSRVDEICERLALVCASVAASAGGATGGTGGGPPAAAGPDLAQYESLVRRVEKSETRSAELATQIQAKVNEMGDTMERLLRAGSSSAP